MKKTFKLIIFSILFGLPIMMTAQVTVSAYILDSETRKPIEWASVVTSTETTITNSEGVFTLKTTDTNGSIKFSHVNYIEQNINIRQLSDTIFLKSKVYELATVYVLPQSVVIRDLKAVWNKYDKIFSKMRTRDIPNKTFYYRQLTQNDDMYTEYMECFFTARTTVGVRSLFLQNGRFASIKNDSIYSFTDFYDLSRIHPFTEKRTAAERDIIPFLTKDFEKYYDVRLDHVISPDNENEIKVYSFTPGPEMKKVYGIIISGLLYVRTKDSSIVRMDANAQDIGVIGSLNLADETYYFTVTYRDGTESYPLVESVRCEAEIVYQRNEQVHQINVHSLLFATDLPVESGGKQMKDGDFLLKEVSESEYNQKFWDDNQFIQRTSIEQRVVDEFNRQGYFGTMKFD